MISRTNQSLKCGQDYQILIIGYSRAETKTWLKDYFGEFLQNDEARFRFKWKLPRTNTSHQPLVGAHQLILRAYNLWKIVVYSRARFWGVEKEFVWGKYEPCCVRVNASLGCKVPCPLERAWKSMRLECANNLNDPECKFQIVKY